MLGYLGSDEMPEDTKKLATLVYILQAVGMFFAFTFIAGIIVNYLKRNAVKGTLAESHFAGKYVFFGLVYFGLL